MEVPNPPKILRFKPVFPSRYQQGFKTEDKRRNLVSPWLAILCFLQFGLHAFFLGQLTPDPLFWALLVIFFGSLSFALFQVAINRSLHSWFWGFLIIFFVLKTFFHPSFGLLDSQWLRELGNGFQKLFALGKGLLSSLRVEELLSSDHNATASFFLFLSLLLWLPVGLSMEKALRNKSFSWSLMLSLLIVVWLEPTRTFPFFFPLELTCSLLLFLLLLWYERKERWRFLRFRFEKKDLKRVVLWSLLIFIPLFIFFLPWAWRSFSQVRFSLPVFPSLGHPSPSIPPASSSGGAFPTFSLPPLALPDFLEALGGYSSYIAIILFFLIGAFLFFRFGKRESLFYFLLAIGVLALALWLLPPYLGPILTRSFYYLKVGIDSFFAALGMGKGGATSGIASSGSEGGASSETSNWIAQFFRSFVLFFSQASVILITIGVLFLGAIFFFVLKFGLRRFPLMKKLGRLQKKEVQPQTGDFLSPLSFYFKLLRILEERGIKRKENETPWEYERRALSKLPFIEEEVGHLTQTFVEARYGQMAPSSQKVLDLQEDLAQLERKLQEEKRNSGK